MEMLWARSSCQPPSRSLAGVGWRESQGGTHLAGSLCHTPEYLTSLAPCNSIGRMGHRLGHLGPRAHKKERKQGVKETVPPGTPVGGSAATHGVEPAEECPHGFKVKPKWQRGEVRRKRNVLRKSHGPSWPCSHMR